MASKTFTIGSKAFFSCYDDFKPHDNDELTIDDEPDHYKIQSYIQLEGNCYVFWKHLTPEEYIEIHKKYNIGLLIGKFLVPEVANYLGFTIEHLKQLKCLIDVLDSRHSYEKIIYESYIQNNNFILTDEQRLAAYEEYKKKR